MEKRSVQGRTPSHHNKPAVFFVTVILSLLLLVGILFSVMSPFLRGRGGEDTTQPPVSGPVGEGNTDPAYPYRTRGSRRTYTCDDAPDAVTVAADGIAASYAAVLDVDSHTLIAGLDPDARMYPASMTKIMTLIVACDHIRSLEDTLTLDKDTYKKATAAGSSIMGVDVGDILTVKDLLYAVALRSAGDAVYLLTDYLAGSEEAFVELMNEKVRDMGLRNTHFANATGLHDEGTYSTAREMAAILAYAMENEFVASLLCAESYQTYLGYYDWGVYKTYRMTFYSTLFRDRLSECGYEDDPAKGFDLLGGKTGFTDEAMYCLASLSQGADGRRYIVVTAGGGDKYSSIADYMVLLNLLHT